MSARTTLERSVLDTSRPLRLLILEHSPADVELILFELQEANIAFGHCLVSSRAEFLGAIADGDFDAILADYRLPDWTGWTPF